MRIMSNITMPSSSQELASSPKQIVGKDISSRATEVELSSKKSLASSLLSDPRIKRKEPPVHNLSAAEIRKRVAEHTAKAESPKVQQQPAKDPAGPIAEKNPTSALSNNDPSNPQTKEKLKSLLSSGSINFNDSERKVLGKILNSEAG